MPGNYTFFRHAIKYMSNITGYLHNLNPFIKKILFCYEIRIFMVQFIVLSVTLNLIIMLISVNIFYITKTS